MTTTTVTEVHNTYHHAVSWPAALVLCAAFALMAWMLWLVFK